MTLDICVTTCAVKKFLYEIRCFSFVSMLKKNDIKKTKPRRVYSFSSNKERKVPAKKETGLGEMCFLWRKLTSIALCEISRFQPCFSSFQNNFFF